MALDAGFIDDGVGRLVGHGHACGFLWQVDECGMVCVEYACTEGCTDNDACNFTGEAGIEDGSCTYPGDSCDDGDETTVDETLDDNCDCVVATDDVIEEDIRLSVLPTLQEVRFSSNPTSMLVRFALSAWMDVWSKRKRCKD